VAEHVHDCVVVGAGPAGSAAALQLARDGLDVVLLERGNRPGEKNVMSGILITDKLFELVPDFEDRAPLQRRIISDYTRHYLTENAVLRSPSIRDYRRNRLHLPYYTVFRSEFDAWFAEEAVDAGAELFTATLVEDLLWEDGRVAGVCTRRGDLRARVVIGADGVNSIVAEKSRLRPNKLLPSEVSLIVREILDLRAERIEERFALEPGEGIISVYTGSITGPTGSKGIYYTELYTNRDSLSLTTEVPLSVLQVCGVSNYDVLAARERHPYIARLIRGATLREYQAHLIPWGGVDDLGCLFGEGVLLVGDAGKFTTKEGVGSWPAMASGAAAARAVKHACEKGDFTRASLAVYLDLLDEEGLVDTQREAHRDWDCDNRRREILSQYPEHLVRLARRYFDSWWTRQDESPYSLWGEAYHSLLKPRIPWYVRLPLGLAVWVDTLRWRYEQVRRRNR
jgi:electron transfer flavoprotein-quinone oxidoreductase